MGLRKLRLLISFTIVNACSEILPTNLRTSSGLKIKINEVSISAACQLEGKSVRIKNQPPGS